MLVGATFIGEIASLYYGALDSGQPAYNPEALRERLIAPFVMLFIWVAVIIAAYIIFEVYPKSDKRPAIKDDARTLKKLRGRIPTRGASDEFAAARAGINSMRTTRVAVWSAAGAVCIAGAIYILVYLLTPSHYHPDALHDDAMNLVRHVISWTAAGLIACFAAAGVEFYAVKRELNFAKIAIKTGDRGSLPAPHISAPLPKNVKLIMLWTARACVLAISIAFIVEGVKNGGADSVLVKGINICTECIGLG